MKSLSPGWLLAFFAGFTSVGYFIYQQLLRDVHFSIVLFGTYFALLVVQFFQFKPEKGLPSFRSPLSSLNAFLDCYSVAYAIFVFLYWLFFWIGMSILPDDENAAVVGLSIFALTTAFIPASIYVTNFDRAPLSDLLRPIGVGAILVICIFLINLNLPGDSLTAAFEYFVVTLEWILEGAPEDFDWNSKLKYADTAPIPFEALFTLGALSILIALLSEAMSDIMNGLRNRRVRFDVGQVADKILRHNASIAETNHFIRQGPLSTLLEEASKKEEDRMTEIVKQFCSVNTKNNNTEDFEIGENLLKECDHRKKQMDTTAEMIKLGSIDATDLQKLNGWRKTIKNEYWGAILNYVRSEREEQIIARVRSIREHGHFDLSAIGGFVFALAIVATVIVRDTGPTIFQQSWSIWLGLLLMVFLGATARVLFITTLISSHGSAAEKLVPPIFAVRPIVLFVVSVIWWMVIIVFEAGTGQEISSFDDQFSFRKKAGWLIGALVTALIAILSWRGISSKSGE
ncbi:MAG: hypothetical protein AAF903_09215 [Pseudomonadota bacterium]